MAELRDNCDDLPAIVGQTTVGNVIAEPSARGGIWIEVREIDLRSVNAYTIHNQPSAALPGPARSSLVGKCVIDAHDATHNIEPIGDLMSRTEGIFLQLPIHVQGSDLQFEGLVFVRSGEDFDAGCFTKYDNMGFRGSGRHHGI